MEIDKEILLIADSPNTAMMVLRLENASNNGKRSRQSDFLCL